MPETREVLEGRLVQGAEEIIYYTLTTTAWGSSPSSITIKAYEVTGGAYTEVTSTVLSGSATVAEDTITLPRLQNLEMGKLYRVEVKFTCNANVFECFFEVEGQR